MNAKIKNEFKRFKQGENYHLDKVLGVHREGTGYVFRVWAPHALEVFLVGDFN